MDLIEHIKCFLRANKFYKKYFQTRVNDLRYACRKYIYYFKYYSFKDDGTASGNTLFFIIDPAIRHPGLSDRFKAMIGCYYIALVNGFDFKIIFEYPFRLNDFLDVNKHDWTAGKEALSYSLRNSRVMAYNGAGKVPRLKKSVHQYHVYSYIGYDILASNRVPNYKRLWGLFFRELFKPKDFIEQDISDAGLEENGYIAVHLRFVNALEHFEANHYNALPPDRREDLTARCLNAIRGIVGEYGGRLPVVVFSDSRVFLSRVKELPVVTLDGDVGHLSFNHGQAVVRKTLLDFFLISRARQVYIIQAPEMYATVYSSYAALVGRKEATIIKV
jgi:hypothetical protein